MSLSEIFQQLEDQLEDLQRNAKFCLNNYDYHHKNNEHEILKSLQEILKESYHDGREYQKAVDKVGIALRKAKDLCQQVDQKLNTLAIAKPSSDPNSSGIEGPTMGHSASFKEESQSDGSFNASKLGDEDKENSFLKE